MFLKQLFLIVFSVNALHYSALIHGSPSRYVVPWNHIAFMAPLAGIRASFHQLLHFQKVTQLLILVYPQCYSCLLGRHSQFLILHFAQTLFITIRLHDSKHLPIIPDGVCFLQDHNISNLQVSLNVCPFLPFLKWLQ